MISGPDNQALKTSSRWSAKDDLLHSSGADYSHAGWIWRKAEIMDDGRASYSM
jgi:hypothetical protein